jgi:hypothetical protein
MGRRSEPRTAISFPVVVRGFDSHGSPFAASTETCDVSSTGASIKGLEGLVESGHKIEIEFNDQKAWFRVQWVGKNGSGKAGQIGVRCLERKYIWGVPPRTWDRDSFGESSGAPEIVTVVQPAAQPQPKTQAVLPRAPAGRRNHGSSPPASPRHAPTTAEVLEAVIRVLLRKGLLERDELAEELDKLKTAKN